jgi:hypothetical protein
MWNNITEGVNKEVTSMWVFNFIPDLIWDAINVIAGLFGTVFI